MNRRFVRVVLSVASVFGAASCGGSEPASNGVDGGTAAALTFWGDVAPLLNEKCVKCHQAGGIGPFRLDSYDDVKRNGPVIKFQVQSRKMPPYLIEHDGTCGDFDDHEALSEAQIARIIQWIDGGMKEGMAVTITPSKPPGLEGATDYKTPTFAPMIQGGPLAEFDDYRCIPVDTPLDRDQFITGYEVVPGNAALVHHVIGFLVDPGRITAGGHSNAEVMQALDEQDPGRIGWPCFGLAGAGVEVEGAPVTWGPGQGPVVYPDKMGVPHKKTDKLIVQLHYNLADPKNRGQSDATTIRLRHADAVERKLIFLLFDGLLDTLFTQRMPDTLPPGMAAATYSWSRSMTELGLGQLPYVDLVAVIPHMHQRGRKNQLDLIKPDATTCASRVENWNFMWQKAYFYKTPPRLEAGTRVSMTCEYDTLDDTMPVRPGWGTRNEMCLDMMMLAMPPGL